MSPSGASPCGRSPTSCRRSSTLSQVGDLSTAAARQVQEVGGLILRAYAQTAAPADRATVLGLVDQLLLNSAYDFARIVDEAER